MPAGNMGWGGGESSVLGQSMLASGSSSPGVINSGIQTASGKGPLVPGQGGGMVL